MIQVQLTSLDQLEVQIEGVEDRIAAALKPSPEVRLLRTVPGIGEILAPLVLSLSARSINACICSGSSNYKLSSRKEPGSDTGYIKCQCDSVLL